MLFVSHYCRVTSFNPVSYWLYSFGTFEKLSGWIIVLDWDHSTVVQFADKDHFTMSNKTVMYVKLVLFDGVVLFCLFILFIFNNLSFSYSLKEV